jgi:hypothetical protein
VAEPSAGRRRRAAAAEHAAARPPGVWPGARELLEPGGPFLVPLLILLIARGAMWMLLPFASEDAYITFRYARHLANGLGWVYNPGERVMGFTSPLWTAWVALGEALIRDPVVWTRLGSVAGDVVTLVGMGALLGRHASPFAARCFTFFFAAWPYFSAVAVSGMENGLLLTGIVVAACAAESRSRWTGPALAALALTRPEGLPAAALIALFARGRDRWIAAAVVAAGFAGLWGYFGSPIPQSLHAKSQLYGTPGPWAGRGWWEWISPFALGRWPGIGEAVHMLPLTVVVAPASVFGTVALWRARRTGLAVAVAAALGIWLGYAVLGVAYFWWYFVVPLAGIAALASVGLKRAVGGRAIPIAVCLYVLGTWTVVLPLYRGRAQNEYNGFAQAASALASRLQPGESVMLEPIGIIGYRNPLRVVDEVGLVSPEVARRRLQGPGWYADVADRERPDWIVIRRGVARRGTAFAGAGAPFRDLAERDSLFARYRLVDVADDRSGDLALEIYRRFR